MRRCCTTSGCPWPPRASRLALRPCVDEDVVFAVEQPLAHTALSPQQREQAAQLRAVHTEAGADFLRQPWFPAATAEGVAASHQNWDGSGDAGALSAEDIPAVARLLRAADLFDGAVAGETNPLTARARVRAKVARWSGRQIEPGIAAALTDVTSDDAFWLGFYDADLARTMVDAAPASGVGASTELLSAFSGAVADLIDAKAGYDAGRGQRVAAYARAMAATLGMNPQCVELIGLAALWNDVGTLGVPSRILFKPSLLSIEEMERMRGHPNFSGQILERISALEPAALWVAAHHERMDGKGYPEMLSGTEISAEAGILSLADAYVAIVSPRPYRDPLPHEDACAILDAGAGGQWDPFLVKVLLEIVQHEEHEAKTA